MILYPTLKQNANLNTFSNESKTIFDCEHFKYYLACGQFSGPHWQWQIKVAVKSNDFGLDFQGKQFFNIIILGQENKFWRCKFDQE
jgi:hypothetical protein